MNELLNERLLKLSALRTRKEELDDLVDQVKGEIEKLSYDLHQEMVASGTMSVRLDGVGLFSLSEQLIPSVKDKEELYKYLRENDQGHVIKTVESVHHMTLLALNNDYNEQFGRDLPGCKSFQKLSVRVTK